MIDVLKYPRGTPLIFTKGEYSDYGLAGLLVTIKDCDLPSLAQAFVADARAKVKDAYLADDDPRLFASWLVANGHAMPMAAETVHLGQYGRFEDEFNVPGHDG